MSILTKPVNLVDKPNRAPLRENKFVVVDVEELIRRLSRDGEFDPTVIESWLARQYAKSHSVPCVATRLIKDDFMRQSLSAQRIRITNAAIRLKVDPMEYLPVPSELIDGNGGIWLLLRGNDLLMGGSHAIERCWRSLYP